MSVPRSGTGAAGCRLPTKPLFSQLSGWVESSRSAQEVVCFQAIGSFGSRDEIPYLESDQTLDPVQPEFLAPRLLKWLNSLYRPALPEESAEGWSRRFPDSLMGRRQVVRQWILIPPYGGSNPPAPASGAITH